MTVKNPIPFVPDPAEPPATPESPIPFVPDPGKPDAPPKSPVPFIPDPADPRAPPQDVWDRMTPEERDHVVAMLPSEFELAPPEGDAHRNSALRALATLDAFFRRIGRSVYLSSDLAVYYPGEACFAPDLFAVLDVETHERMKWVVATEGKGLDVVVEVHVAGDASKDLVRNVERYARLGIPEYFVFDRERLSLRGYRLPEPSGPALASPGRARAYQRIMPQGGRFPSNVLGLDLALEGSKLRFYAGTASLPDADEMIAKLSSMLDDVIENKLKAEARVAELEAEIENKLKAEARAAAEAERALKLEERVAALEAEIERLKRGG